MAVLPAEIPTGLITGQFYFVNEDNVDADTDPDLTVVQGDVTFTCTADAPLRMPTKLATIIPLEFKGEFDSQGRLVPKGRTELGIELPATNSSLFNPTGFTWKVEFNLTQVSNRHTVQIDPYEFQVPEGTTQDLTLVMPVDASPGTLTVQGPQGAPGDMSLVVGPANISGTVTLVEADLPSTRLRTLTGNVTFVLPTPVATPARSGTITLVLTQDATGNRTITWPSSVKWPDGIAQQPAAAANSVSVIHLLWTGAQWLGMSGGKSFA
jgi:hypothetical protein